MRADVPPVVRPAGLSAATDEEIAAALRGMVRDPSYPCVGAKSVVNRNTAQIAVLDHLADPGTTNVLLERLTTFLNTPVDDGGFRSFLAAFRTPLPGSEEEFEVLLWRQLELLRDADPAGWDPSVSDDPASARYCFSVAGTATFVIGMHPGASRVARRAPLPVLVFNPHAQFERLRAAGGYDRVRNVVRRRDAQLQGSVNPMVADHGDGSEARQYSGRVVGDDWRAPSL